MKIPFRRPGFESGPPWMPSLTLSIAPPLRKRPNHFFGGQIERPYGIALAFLDLHNNAFAEDILMGLRIEPDAVPWHDELGCLDVRREQGLLNLCRGCGLGA